MRKPDLVIGPTDRPYIFRWHLFRFRGWQLCLHKIFRSDDSRALHDHKATNLSIILSGCYTEFPGKWGHGMVYGPFSVIFRRAETAHRLVLDEGKHVWSLWLRWPPTRVWGFYPKEGWMPAREYWKKYGEEA